VYCFHHELLYEAKVLEVRPVEGDEKKNGFEYRVHYKGWKNTYVYPPTQLIHFASGQISLASHCGKSRLPPIALTSSPLPNHLTTASHLYQ